MSQKFHVIRKMDKGGGYICSLHCRRIFGKGTLTWKYILKAEEGWGEIEISTKGVVDRQEEGVGRERGKSYRLSLPTPSLPTITKIKHNGSENYLSPP